MQGKIESGQWGWLLSGVERRPLWFLIWSLADVATALPLGLGFGMSVRGRSPGYALAAAYGFFVGAFIEVAQFFTASGISQGWSVLTRMAGVCLGLFLYRGAARLSAASVASVLRRLTLPFMAVGAVGVVSVASGKFSDATGNFNSDGAEANNTVTLSVNTVTSTFTDAPG